MLNVPMIMWLTDYPQKCPALQCDVTNWDDQATLLEEAITFSSCGITDMAIAKDELSALRNPLVQPGDLSDPATKPDLRILDVNLRGALHDAFGAALPHKVSKSKSQRSCTHTHEQHVRIR